MGLGYGGVKRNAGDEEVKIDERKLKSGDVWKCTDGFAKPEAMD